MPSLRRVLKFAIVTIAVCLAFLVFFGMEDPSPRAIAACLVLMTLGAGWVILEFVAACTRGLPAAHPLAIMAHEAGCL